MHAGSINHGNYLLFPGAVDFQGSCGTTVRPINASSYDNGIVRGVLNDIVGAQRHREFSRRS
jgi:hypothetical protein